MELIQPKIEIVKHKFLSEQEQKLLPVTTPQLLTLLWSCKEAVYKWYGKGEIDFKKNMVIKEIFTHGESGIIKCDFIKDTTIQLNIEFKIFENLCLAWVCFLELFFQGRG